MKQFMVGFQMRFFFFMLAIFIGIGVWLSGYRDVHWFSYVPPVFLLFAAVTGICPGMGFARIIFKGKS